MKHVKVYSTNACPYCHIAKAFLKEHNVEFEEVNVQEDPAQAEEMVKKSGQYGVPVIEVGDQVVVGFDKQKLKALLGI
jgi:glutaredoxin-like YruB-family protein